MHKAITTRNKLIKDEAYTPQMNNTEKTNGSSDLLSRDNFQWRWWNFFQSKAKLSSKDFL